jgi:hypothetical protein
MKKTKRKSPSSTLGATMDHFANQFQGPEIHGKKKVRKQALVILSLEIS